MYQRGPQPPMGTAPLPPSPGPSLCPREALKTSEEEKHSHVICTQRAAGKVGTPPRWQAARSGPM